MGPRQTAKSWPTTDDLREMENVMSILELLIAMASLVIVDALAMRFGADSRDGFGERASRRPERPFFTAR